MARALLYGLLLFSSAQVRSANPPIAPPPIGKLYHGFYWGGIGTDTHDPSEHDVAPQDVARYEAAIGAKTTWIFFSDNWFESRSFPVQICSWVRDLGKIPYIRLMLRSDVDQKHIEKRFSLEKIIAGEFDADLSAWAQAARNFASPILIEWGTEPNGDWFAWNGKWNGGAEHGPSRFVQAYRHIVDIMRGAGADNLQWVWHVNWDDQPDTKWNRFENYFPGEKYVDWMALSAYGPTTPTTRNESESFAYKINEAYPRLVKLAPGKPIIVAEFGCDLHNRHVDATAWARDALENLFSDRWPAVIGFCWWNEGWQNDETKRHDSDLIILHSPALTDVFQHEFAAHRDKIQANAIMTSR
jgi:hypothetical protein